MTWDAFHRRGEVLRAVTELLDARRDGVLPMDAPGVVETFGSEAALLAALHLRWHNRLTGHIERALMDYPEDLESAVVGAWRATAGELPGLRAVLDRYVDQPTSDETAALLDKARRKEWAMLAAQAGLAGPGHPDAAAAGRALELRVRGADVLAA